MNLLQIAHIIPGTQLYFIW